MFGFGKKNKRPQDGTQIPYQVYETVQGSNPARWPRLVLASVLALGILVLIVFGGIKLYRNISDSYSGDGPSGTGNNAQQQAGSDDAKKSDGGGSDSNSQPKSDPDKTQQSPQNNPSIPKPNGDPASTSQSGSTNNSKIDGPE